MKNAAFADPALTVALALAVGMLAQALARHLKASAALCGPRGEVEDRSPVSPDLDGLLLPLAVVRGKKVVPMPAAVRRRRGGRGLMAFLSRRSIRPRMGKNYLIARAG